MEQNIKKTSLKIRLAIYIIIIAVAVASITTAIILGNYGILDEGIVQIITDSMIIIGLICIALLAMCISKLFEKDSEQNHKLLSTQNITRIAIMTALSYILYQFVKFNVPIFPAFLDFHISEVPALICGFMMGPASGCLVILFKVLLKLPFSSTVMVGELADLIMGVALVLPASIIYKHLKSRKGAIIGLCVGVACTIISAILLNIFILIPWYVELFFGGSWDSLVGLCSALYADITIQNFFETYITFAVIPFNLIRGVVNALITFFIYKSLHRFFDKMVPPTSKTIASNCEK